MTQPNDSARITSPRSGPLPGKSGVVRVLVVDDSALARQAISLVLSSDPGISIVGTAADAYAARDKVVELSPDVLILDVNMPRMDGIAFLKRLMVYRPTPVVILSALTAAGTAAAVEAMQCGAVEVLQKPGETQTLRDIAPSLIAAVHAAARTKVSRGVAGIHVLPAVDSNLVPRSAETRVFALGASTGGVQALTAILSAFPSDAPPVLVVQHMPERFTAAFAERLRTLCKMDVKEAAEGDSVDRGRVLIAPGNRHMLLAPVSGDAYRVRLSDDARVAYQRPSVDVLFHSIARNIGAHCVAALLTGMGNDGAEGLLAIRRAGGRTIAQSQDTCVVFGMPAAAIACDASERVVPLDAIAPTMLEMTQKARNVPSDMHRWKRSG